MKKFLFALAFVACLPLTAQAAHPPFMGHWHWAKGSEELDLYLDQTGPKISGYHTAIGQEGAKVDEVTKDQPPSLTGTANGLTATLDFRSGFPDSTGHGTAQLSLKMGQLEWKTTHAEGEEYFPLHAVLNRVKD